MEYRRGPLTVELAGSWGAGAFDRVEPTARELCRRKGPRLRWDRADNFAAVLFDPADGQLSWTLEVMELA
jgi:hypothetical protein